MLSIISVLNSNTQDERRPSLAFARSARGLEIGLRSASPDST